MTKIGPYVTPGYTIGDCRALLRAVPDESVHCVVTSPPYWRLRDYGTGPGQLGLEYTIDDYLSNMVAVFREVRRTLRHDGTLWLNMGDGYVCRRRGTPDRFGNDGRKSFDRPSVPTGDLKYKDLVGMPWRLALALQADGWWLRRDIVWAKPNPVPESVYDRPTTAHEYLFLLSKSASYFYDSEAVKEPVSGTAHPRGDGGNPKAQPCTGELRPRQNESFSTAVSGLVTHRNKRSVWTIPTYAYSGAHYATYPPKLVEPCILAGTSPTTCGVCGAPWRRRVEVEYDDMGERSAACNREESINFAKRAVRHSRTVGWDSGCAHDDNTGRAVVLDPFLGSGTTAMVAEQLSRNWLGFEEDSSCAELIDGRLAYTQRDLLGVI